MQEDERTVLTGEVQQSIGKNDLSVVRFLQKPKFLRVRRLHPFEGIGPDKEPATVVTEITRKSASTAIKPFCMRVITKSTA